MTENRKGRQRRHRRESKHDSDHDDTGEIATGYNSSEKAQHYQENRRTPVTPSLMYEERQAAVANRREEEYNERPSYHSKGAAAEYDNYDNNRGGATKYESFTQPRSYENNRAAPLTTSPLYQEQQAVMASQHEEDYSQQIMREREAEILEINRKVHTVNEIYADLANIIGEQQDLIDNIDNNIDDAHANAMAGKGEIEDARLYAEKPIYQDFFGDKLNTPVKGEDGGTRSPKRKKRRGKKKSRSRTKDGEDMDCLPPLASLQGDLKDVVNDIKTFGAKLIMSCAAPEVGDVTEYQLR